MKIIIIRHAEPDYKNNTLTSKGFKEAEILGNYLKNEKIDFLYVSPLNRAKYTSDGLIKYNSKLKPVFLDWIREFDARIDLPYKKDSLSWDLHPSFLNDNKIFYDFDNWQKQENFNENFLIRYNDFISKLDELIKSHGYEKKGVYYNALKPNHDVLCFVCHFGLECYLLSRLLNFSPIAIANHFVAQPSSFTIVSTEEREKGKAIFRLSEFGSVEHLRAVNEKPSFMARFDEVYGDGNCPLQ